MPASFHLTAYKMDTIEEKRRKGHYEPIPTPKKHYIAIMAVSPPIGGGSLQSQHATQNAHGRALSTRNKGY